MELLQKGIIKQDIYDQVATTKVAAKHKVRRRKLGKKGDPTTNLLAHLDAFNTTAVAPNLDELVGQKRDMFSRHLKSNRWNSISESRSNNSTDCTEERTNLRSRH